MFLVSDIGFCKGSEKFFSINFWCNEWLIWDLEVRTRAMKVKKKKKSQYFPSSPPYIIRFPITEGTLWIIVAPLRVFLHLRWLAAICISTRTQLNLHPLAQSESLNRNWSPSPSSFICLDYLSLWQKSWCFCGPSVWFWVWGGGRIRIQTMVFAAPNAEHRSAQSSSHLKCISISDYFVLCTVCGCHQCCSWTISALIRRCKCRGC